MQPDSTTASFMVNAADLRMLVTRLLRFVSTAGTQPVLECIKLEADNECLRGIAVDGYVLGIQEIEYTEKPKQATTALFRPRPVLAVLKGLGTEGITVTITETRIEFVAAWLSFSVPQETGKFPDIEGLKLPADGTRYSVSINPRLLHIFDGGLGLIHIELGENDMQPVPVASSDGFYGLAMPMFDDVESRARALAKTKQAAPKVKAQR